MATRTRRRLTWAWLLVVGLAAAAAAEQSTAKISPKDQIKITVLGTNIEVGPYLVDSTGAIEYPYIGRLRVADMTPRELQAEIAQRLVALQVLVGSPQVIAELSQTPNKSITVSGAVNSRGEYLFAGEPTVFAALVRAGGASEEAGDEVIVIRRPRVADPAVPAAKGAADPDPQAPAEEIVTLSRKDIESGVTTANVTLQDGDRVVVQRARQVYIDGQVNRPGAYTIETGTTLRQALSLAGGATQLGALNRIRILRNGKQVPDVDLDKTIVQPGDTITVQRRFM